VVHAVEVMSSSIRSMVLFMRRIVVNDVESLCDTQTMPLPPGCGYKSRIRFICDCFNIEEETRLFQFMQRIMHEHWVESIDVQSVFAYHFVAEIRFAGAITSELSELNEVLRRGLLRDGGDMCIQTIVEYETDHTIEFAEFVE
jgi:hypothetical protein